MFSEELACQGGLLSETEIYQLKGKGQYIRISDDELLKSNKLREIKKDLKHTLDSGNSDFSLVEIPHQKAKKFNFVSYKGSKLFENGLNLNLNDIKQRGIGECFFDAALLSITNSNPLAILHMMRDQGDSVCIKVYEQQPNGKKTPYIYELDKSVIQGNNLLIPFNKHLLWAGILEKAYAFNKQRLLNAYAQDIDPGDNLYVSLTGFIDGGHSHKVFDTFFDNEALFTRFNLTPNSQLDVNKKHGLGYFFHLYQEYVIKDIANHTAYQDELSKISAQLDLINNKNSFEYEFLLAFKNLCESLRSGNISDILDKLNKYNLLLRVDSSQENNSQIMLDKLKKVVEETCPVLHKHIQNYCFLRESSNLVDDSRFERAVTDLISYALASGCVISVATKDNFGKKIPFIPELMSKGFAASHAYALLEVKSFGDSKSKLVLMNPWQHYSASYDRNNQVKGMFWDKSKVSKEKFDRSSAQPTDEYDDAVTGGLITNNDRKTEFYGASEIEFKELVKYFDGIYISKPSNELVILNQVLAVLAASIRFGFNDNSVKQCANNLLTIINIEGFGGPLERLDSIIRFVKKFPDENIIGLKNADKIVVDLMRIMQNDCAKQNIIQQLGELVKQSRKLSITMSPYEFIDYIATKLNNFSGFIPTTKDVLDTYWFGNLKARNLSSRMTVEALQPYEDLISKIKVSLEDDQTLKRNILNYSLREIVNEIGEFQNRAINSRAMCNVSEQGKSERPMVSLFYDQVQPGGVEGQVSLNG
ncbi:hypothetical protein L3V82_11820 [Thiotrichales bacterium 19S3-7]|nr:hypothetical protein [Thiotrichales bacterium 19S3-7]MCF6802901.1 hypothetical protein [Thiotrichales bacterium 19S3-11]